MVVIRREIDVQRKKIIEKGGDESRDKNKKWTTICLRIPIEMVLDIDSLIEEKMLPSRTAWILQTLNEKIREENG